MKLGWSLKAFLMAYSAGFILCFYAVYNIIVYLFRNPNAGILLALALGLTVRYKFYAPVGESLLAMVPLILLLGWLSKPKVIFSSWPAWADVAVGIFLGALLLTSHPFVTVGAALGIGFLFIYHREWRNVRLWIVSLVTGALLLKVFVLGERNAYEAERANRMEEAWTVLSNLQDYYISEVILRYFDTQYTFPFLIFLLSLGLLVAMRRYWTAIYLTVSFLVVLAIIIVMHAYMTSNIYNLLDGYMSNLGFIWALPLAYHWVTEKKPWMLLTICALLIFSLFRISDSKNFLSETTSLYPYCA